MHDLQAQLLKIPKGSKRQFDLVRKYPFADVWNGRGKEGREVEEQAAEIAGRRYTAQKRCEKYRGARQIGASFSPDHIGDSERLEFAKGGNTVRKG